MRKISRSIFIFERRVIQKILSPFLIGLLYSTVGTCVSFPPVNLKTSAQPTDTGWVGNGHRVRNYKHFYDLVNFHTISWWRLFRRHNLRLISCMRETPHAHTTSFCPDIFRPTCQRPRVYSARHLPPYLPTSGGIGLHFSDGRPDHTRRGGRSATADAVVNPKAPLPFSLLLLLLPQLLESCRRERRGDYEKKE